MAMPGDPAELGDDSDDGSILSSPANRRFELRSSSSSSWAAKNPSDIFPSSSSNQVERRFGRKRKAKRSVTFEDILGSEGERQKLSWPANDKERRAVNNDSDSGERRSHLWKSEEYSGAPNEHKDALTPSGTVQRHPMFTVSQDDYLLARGANPRTGIITPGHSLQDSVDGQETLQTRMAAEESKWRQRGNQWISLGVDQPTSHGSPPKLDSEVPQQQQIPRKPVGSPPKKDSRDRERSSTAPTTRKFKYFQPSDIGKGLPTAPPEPFLGHLRSSGAVNVPKTGLRCPPTSSTPSLSPLSNQVRLRIPHGSHLSNRAPKPSGPRGGDPSYPYLRYQKPQIPPRHYHLIQNLQADQKINGPRRPQRHDIEVVHPPFQPRSLRGRMSGPGEMAMPGGSYPHYVIEDNFTTHLNTISMNTDTPIPSFTNNDKFESEPKPSENTSLPLTPTRLGEGQQPGMSDRSDGMTDVRKMSHPAIVQHQLNLADMSDGGIEAAKTPLQPSNLTGTNTGATDPERTPTPTMSTKINYRGGSFGNKLRNMLGSIRTFDGPAEAEVDLGDTLPCPAARGRECSERAIATAKRALSHSDCATGLDTSCAVCLEPLVAALLFRLLDMGSCIIQTLARILRMSYVYSETGNMKMEAGLVLDVLRSIVYASILGATAVALTRVAGLVMKVGTGVIWVLKGVFWVLT